MMNSIILLLLFIFQTATAQKANTNTPKNPFLSTTLSTKITSVSGDFDFDSERKSLFSETLTNFLHKIFEDQQVYDVRIISVSIFDDHLLKDGHVVETKREDRNNDDDAQHALSFTTVVAAEYINEEDIDSIANDNFRKMLVHVCDKFQGHLIKFMKDTGDPYFMNVESVALGDFERIHGNTRAGQQSVQAASTNDNNEVLGMSGDALNTASIVAIAVGSIVLVVLSIASIWFYRKEKELEEMEWQRKETFTLSSTKSSRESSSITSPGPQDAASHPMVDDDYSFTPPGSSSGYHYEEAIPPINGYNGTVPPYTDYTDDNTIHNNTSSINEEEIAFSSVWPESSPPAAAATPATLFPAPGTVTTEKAILSYTEELNTLPRKTIFAPPGKIGVAIDVYNGQPVVHKVRRGSPVENMLRANDIIVAIDDEDTSCLSAADVTSMMVKRMDRVRKITFVRRD